MIPSVGECEASMEREEQDQPDSTTCDKEDLAMGGQDKANGGQIQLLTNQKQQIISNLVIWQEEHASYYAEELSAITPFPSDDDPMYSVKSALHIVEITSLTVRLIAEFCRRVPGFDTISREDQTIMTKACSTEIYLLWTSRRYDMETDSTTTPYNERFTREDYRRSPAGNSVDLLFDFYRTMNILKVDDAEYALLAAILIFSERPSLLEPEKVEKQQEFYIEILKSYIATSRPDDEDYFSKLHSLLPEIRILGEMKTELRSL
ncbi:unnamed protein product [Larinioides sclopetarius]|uniref:NR LBD domain-containing protein n=1 Tax=Larinioides sclopetarius TaxID=280406 RepID=A0AAV1ZTY2_9ARAC